MRGIRRIVVAALLVALAIGIAVMGASELGGEVVTLHTASPDGEVTTRIWIVDDTGYAWLRAGVPENGWLLRIDANPDVVVERGGESLRFRAVPVRNDPAVRDRIHARMRQDYGLADRIVSLLRDASKSVPVRLDPIAEPVQPD